MALIYGDQHWFNDNPQAWQNQSIVEKGVHTAPTLEPTGGAPDTLLYALYTIEMWKYICYYDIGNSKQ